MIETPDIAEEGAGDGIEKDHIGDVDAKKIMAGNNENKHGDKSDGADGIEKEIAPHGDFGNTESGALGGIGGAMEALFLVGFAGVGFDTEDISDGVGELAGLFVFGGGESGVDMTSFVKGDGGDGRVSDGEDEHDGAERRADEPGGNDGINNNEDKGVDVPDEFGLQSNKGVGELVGLGGKRTRKMVAMESHRLVDNGVKSEVGEVLTAFGV